MISGRTKSGTLSIWPHLSSILHALPKDCLLLNFVQLADNTLCRDCHLPAYQYYNILDYTYIVEPSFDDSGNQGCGSKSGLVLPTLRFFTIEIFRFFAFVNKKNLTNVYFSLQNEKCLSFGKVLLRF
jgi:hypothetical protein